MGNVGDESMEATDEVETGRVEGKGREMGKWGNGFFLKWVFF